MTSKGEQERERLKEEYKEHYRKIRETKEKLRRSKYVKNVNEALQQMHADELLDSVNEFLGNIRNKMAHIEARLDVVMEQMLDTSGEDAQLDESFRKEQARDTLKQIKMEMGLLYSEVEKQANELHADKTVGRSQEQAENNEENNPDI